MAKLKVAKLNFRDEIKFCPDSPLSPRACKKEITSRKGGWLHVTGLEEPLFFRLKGAILSEHASENSIALRCVNITGAKIRSHARRFKIVVKTVRAETYCFFARNREEWNEWVVALETSKRQRNINDYYRFGQKIGEGSFGSVKKAVRITTKEVVAVKIIDRSKYKGNEKKYLSGEISIVMSVDHPSIIETYDIFDDGDKLYIVMKYIDGGTLEDCLGRNGSYLSEEVSQHVICELLSALSLLHTCGIVHRDIKTDNILCSFEDGDFSKPVQVKLSDFGLGAMIMQSDVSSPKALRSVVGSWYYISPEQARCERYDSSVDMWALGVLLYRLLSGEYPFANAMPQVMLDCIREGSFQFSRTFDDRNISQNARNFISQLLCRDVEKRLTAVEALAHPWVNGNDNYRNNKIARRICALSALEESRLKLHHNRNKDMDLHDLYRGTNVQGLKFDEAEISDSAVPPLSMKLRILSRRLFVSDTNVTGSSFISPRSWNRNRVRDSDEEPRSNPASPFGY